MGVLGAYLFIIFTFTCQHDQLVGVCSGRLKKGGLRCGSNSKKGGGVLGAGQVKKGVFTAAHTYTEHICQCPPPPPAMYYLKDNT